MKKAGILAQKGEDDYLYIGTFIGFLERIINIIIKLFKELGNLSGKKEEAEEPAATPTDG